MKLYLAAPLFTSAERAFNVELWAALEKLGHEVWLPQAKDDYSGKLQNSASIFALDRIGLDWSEAVIANMDGPDPDSGTAWECGYSYAKGKPVIIFRTDCRSADDAGAPFNIMLAESALAVVSQHAIDEPVAELAARISDELKACTCSE